MTKEITKAIILQEIQDKFKLRDFDPAKFLFDETVVPVYDVKHHFENTIMAWEEVSITSADSYTFFTVPQTERWHLERYNVIFMGVAGQIKVTGVFVQEPVGASEYIYFDMEEAQTVSYADNLPYPVTLEPGERLRILVDDYTSTQNLRLYIRYLREVIR